MQTNYLFGQQRTVPQTQQTLLRSVQSTNSSVSGVETVYVAQEVLTPVPAPAARQNAGQETLDTQRLANLDLH